MSAFVADHFGQEAVDYLAEPLLAGVYGGSPDVAQRGERSAEVCGVRAAIRQRGGGRAAGEAKPAGESVFKSLRDGMGTLIDALARAEPRWFRRAWNRFSPADTWGVFADGEWHEFDRDGALLRRQSRRSPDRRRSMRGQASCLPRFRIRGSAIWTFGYRREDMPHPLDAFGFLVPKRERNTIMACTWVATKWLGRVPEGKAVLRCFSTDPNVSKEAMRADLRRLMGITAEPLFALCNRWPDSMPQ